ncbi:DNA-binding GntR family transcriptional regulator [Arthrobacter sp. BE255]|nr:FCD domain-containing protein [Arthrobacter sp. BE255]MDR7159152.1 DNA-binding GntR family transcriptional regulator [Arthrobacter sp. BE255]
MLEQQELVDGRIWAISGSELFDLNTRFHETLVQCSNNDFFIESLARINRLRRLIEYRQALVPERALVRCEEHVGLAKLLLAGELKEASSHLRDHLSSVASEKTLANQPKPVVLKQAWFCHKPEGMKVNL